MRHRVGDTVRHARGTLLYTGGVSLLLLLHSSGVCSTTGVAGSAASAEGLRRICQRSVPERGPMPEEAHRDLTFDRGHGQGETGGATVRTRGGSCN